MKGHKKKYHTKEMRKFRPTGITVFVNKQGAKKYANVMRKKFDRKARVKPIPKHSISGMRGNTWMVWDKKGRKKR